ncbi:helix-turn-helix domain-containing protein [Rickettsia endosymbiont of Cardiosporidium cionae]|uniref:helix-turn-helix domain-containing protein n=1 Tax=Rickettsia endosymbiont of Cardiosporidium cionae TaxID=2777155 RepID=UPI0018956886|nr:helix-turn-helix domain-containing protein [Rickettsia endosymbiont of Cardiosporidium cionae]KAF8818580.1 XRE family transcriptional regulator [Rickettsia endosymbiont of Cardiosporidium cionae]
MSQTETKGRAGIIDRLVSKRLRMRRIMLGLSQHEIGKALDVSIQQIQKYEKAVNRISSGKLHILARFLQVPVSYFFDTSGEESTAMSNLFVAEEPSQYNGETHRNCVSEREIISLVQAFSEIKSSNSRKKIIELTRVMS